MKRFAIVALLSLAFLLLVPVAAHAGTYTGVIQAPGGLQMNDVHIRAYYWTPGPTMHPLPITGGSVRWPNGSSAGTSTVSGETTLTCETDTPWPLNQWFQVKITSSISPRCIYWWYEWTIDGVVFSQPLGRYEDITVEYDGGAEGGLVTLDAYVQRSIKMTIGDDALSFGRVRYSDPAAEVVTTLRVESNDEYSLYVSGHPDEVLSRGDMCDFLNVQVDHAASGWMSETGLGGMADGYPCALIGEDIAGGTLELPPASPDWWIDSFFDVTFQLDPDAGDRPGYYKCDVDFFAIQNL